MNDITIHKEIKKSVLVIKTASGLVKYCKAQLGKPYWYGTFGQLSTKSLYIQKKLQYPAYYKAKDYDDQMGQKVHDCIGLIKGFMWCTDSSDAKPRYASNGFKDYSADGYLRKAKVKGSIATMPDVEGVAVFMKGHVGVYIGDGKVIEARGHSYGVVETKLTERKWTHWAYIDEIKYSL